MGAFSTAEYQFSDTTVAIMGKTLGGLRGLTFKKTQKKEVVYGQGNEPRAIQRGNKAYEGTLTILKSDFDDMQLAAKAAGYQDIIDVPHKLITLTCVFSKDGLNSKTHTLIGVEFTEYDDGMKQDDMFKEISLPFIYLRLKTV